MPTRKTLLMMTTAAAICTAPMLAFGQANTGGSSMQNSTTQTTPNQGGLTAPAARDSATTGREMGPSTGTGPVAPRPPQGQAQGQQNQGQNQGQAQQGSTTPGGDANLQSTGRNANPSGAATGTNLGTAGGTAAAPGAPADAAGRSGGPGPGQQSSPLGGTTSAPGTAAAPAQTGAAAGAATGATAASRPAESGAMTGGRRASRVIGASVYNEHNESIGEVEDIVLPQGGGQPMAVLSVGGFLGIGGRLIAVPYDRLQRSNDRDRWTIQGATRDSVRSMPEFTYPEERRG